MITFKFLRFPFVVCVPHTIDELVTDIIINITSREAIMLTLLHIGSRLFELFSKEVRVKKQPGRLKTRHSTFGKEGKYDSKFHDIWHINVQYKYTNGKKKLCIAKKNYNSIFDSIQFIYFKTCVLPISQKNTNSINMWTMFTFMCRYIDNVLYINTPEFGNKVGQMLKLRSKTQDKAKILFLT